MFDPIHISNAQPSLLTSWYNAYSIAKKSNGVQKPIPRSDEDISTPLLQKRKKKAVFDSIFNSIKKKVMKAFKTSTASETDGTKKRSNTKSDSDKVANPADSRTKNKKKARQTTDSAFDDIDLTPVFHDVIQRYRSAPIEVEELFLDEDGDVLITSALISAGKKLIDLIGQIDFD